MHHDADEIVVPGQAAAQVQHGQHGLRRDRERDLVGDDEALGTMELLVAQELRRERAQPLDVGGRALGQEGIARERGLPGGFGNRGQGARMAQAAQPVEHRVGCV